MPFASAPSRVPLAREHAGDRSAASGNGNDGVGFRLRIHDSLLADAASSLLDTDLTLDAASSVHSALRSAGQPLDPTTRAFMEPRFHYDFSQVRVHSDTRAEESARDLNASAYTVGSHIVFAQGHYAPQTFAGRKLIAHELTHVVQQGPGIAPSQSGPLRIDASGEAAAEEASENVVSGHSVGRVAGGRGPSLQRKLIAAGSAPRIRAFLRLLESGSGLTLKHDPKTHEVVIVASVAKPRSVSLASRLITIIGDPDQDAELNLGGAQPGLSFGAFPMGQDFVQRIDIDALTNLEAGAPGSGVAFMIHEIVENYRAHNRKLQLRISQEVNASFSKNNQSGRAHQAFREGLFEVAHAEALEAESAVGGELVGRGSRVASAVSSNGKGVVRSVDDYENYFLVFDRDDKGLTGARQSPRVRVGTFTVQGFAAGSTDVPAGAQSTVAAVADAMAKNPLSTVRIECGGSDAHEAIVRAARVQMAILESGKDRKLSGFDLRSDRNFNLVTTGAGARATITVDQPDTEVEASRGRLVSQWLKERAKR